MNEDLKLWLEFIESDDKIATELLIRKMQYTDDKRGLDEFLRRVFIPMAKKSMGMM